MRIFALLCVLLAGCSKPAAEITELKARLARAEQGLAGLTDNFETNHSKLRRRVVDLEFDKIAPPAVILDATAQARYQPIETGVGKLLVILRSAEPYLDGYKLIISFGNPYACELKGLEVTASVGTNKMQKFSFPSAFKSGWWTDVELILSPARSEDLKHIELWADTDTVSLYVPKTK